MIGRVKRILIVEDNADLRDLLTIVIRRLGYEAAIATTGEEAVEHTPAIKPDLILMDIGLPNLNGVEATLQIKANPATKDIPVVILSALPMSTHGSHALEAGAAEILQKPVRVSDLEHALMKYSGMENGRTQSSRDSSVAHTRSQDSSVRRFVKMEPKTSL